MKISYGIKCAARKLWLLYLGIKRFRSAITLKEQASITDHFTLM